MCEVFCKDCKHYDKISHSVHRCRATPCVDIRIDSVKGVQEFKYHKDVFCVVNNKNFDCSKYKPTLIKRFKELF